MKLWLAQGFGIGRIPVAPGTFGSLLGILWFAMLLLPGHLWCFIAGTGLGLALSVWLCGEGEQILRQKDPGSVVLDEIAAIPLCFAGWLGLVFCQTGTFPTLDTFFSRRTWPLSLGIFAAFRFFDVVKPWPVRQSQAFPGGWGITVDDFLAGIYVSLVTLVVYGATRLMH